LYWHDAQLTFPVLPLQQFASISFINFHLKFELKWTSSFNTYGNPVGRLIIEWLVTGETYVMYFPNILLCISAFTALLFFKRIKVKSFSFVTVFTFKI